MMRITWKLTVASLKMFFRQREAILWTFIFPMMMMFLFAFINVNGLGKIDLGVVNDGGKAGEDLISRLDTVRTVRILRGDKEAELRELEKGERDMVLVIPATFGSQDPPEPVTAFTNDEKPQEAQIGSLILQRLLDEMALERAGTSYRVLLRTQPVKTRNLSYLDFLLPGILAMSIMQMGIFGVAFGFVQLKKRGILRRLSVTPIRSSNFIVAQVITRLVVVMGQILLMIAIAIFFLHVHFIGNLIVLLFVGVLGSVVFLAIGFALAGISKSEDQVAPLANLISLPMLLLSGVFFSRTRLPGIIHVITGFFPLTYLADGMRSVAVDGSTLFQLGPQLAGLVVWSIVSVAIAVKLFRWE